MILQHMQKLGLETRELISAISSRKMVPLLASSNFPGWRRMQPRAKLPVRIRTVRLQQLAGKRRAIHFNEGLVLLSERK